MDILTKILLVLGTWLLSWLSQGVRRRFGMKLMNYQVSYAPPLLQYMRIYFKFRWWQRLLEWLLVPPIEVIKPEIRYKYDGETKWRMPALEEIWEDTQNNWTTVKGTTERVITAIFTRTEANELFQVDEQRGSLAKGVDFF